MFIDEKTIENVLNDYPDLGYYGFGSGLNTNFNDYLYEIRALVHRLMVAKQTNYIDKSITSHALKIVYQDILKTELSTGIFTLAAILAGLKLERKPGSRLCYFNISKSDYSKSSYKHIKPKNLASLLGVNYASTKPEVFVPRENPEFFNEEWAANCPENIGFNQNLRLAH